MSGEGEEAQEPRKGSARRDVRGPEEQGAGMVEMLFLDVVISVHHQSADLSVPAQQLKVLRARPSLWKEGSAERRCGKVDRIR